MSVKKMCTVGGAIVAMVVAVGVMSLLPWGGEEVAARPLVTPSANVAHASASSEDIHIKAVEGTLSVFRGEVTKYADHLWVIENEDGKFVVEEVNDTLIVYNADEEIEAVAETVVGTVQAFMAVLVAAIPCIGCTDLVCCAENCVEESCAWCVCVAINTCGENGVEYINCENGGCGGFGCYPPSQQ